MTHSLGTQSSSHGAQIRGLVCLRLSPGCWESSNIWVPQNRAGGPGCRMLLQLWGCSLARLRERPKAQRSWQWHLRHLGLLQEVGLQESWPFWLRQGTRACVRWPEAEAQDRAPEERALLKSEYLWAKRTTSLQSSTSYPTVFSFDQFSLPTRATVWTQCCLRPKHMISLLDREMFERATIWIQCCLRPKHTISLLDREMSLWWWNPGTERQVMGRKRHEALLCDCALC